MLLAAERCEEILWHRLESRLLQAAQQFVFDAAGQDLIDLQLLEQPDRFTDDFARAGVTTGSIAGFQPGVLFFSQGDFHHGILPPYRIIGKAKDLGDPAKCRMNEIRGVLDLANPPSQPIMLAVGLSRN